MLYQVVLVILVFLAIAAEANIRNHGDGAPTDTNIQNHGDGAPTGTHTMLGVDTVHDVKIDKNTVITRNLKIGQRDKMGKSAAHHKSEQEERAPDWSYSSIPSEVSAYAEDFKRNMTECLKEVQSKDKRTVRRLSPSKDSPVHGDCLIACVLARNDVIVNGKVHKDNLIALVSKFFAKDTHLIKKLAKSVDRCIDVSARAGDECQLAASLNDCTNQLMATNKHRITLNY